MLFEETNFITDKFAIDELLRRSWSFRTSDEFTKFFDFIARFRHYSRYNSMLVYIQNQAVTFFGGVSFWRKKFDRTIKKDARPYIILAPNGPIMLVYDVFDTEGQLPPEEFLKKGLGREPFEVRGYLDERILDIAIEESRRWGITVNFKPFSYFKAGHVTTIYSGHLEICLNEIMSPEINFTTLIHELAHLFLGHTGHPQMQYEGKEKATTLLQRELTKTTKELEAEAVSYLICHKLGLESRAAEYIAGYITCEDDLLKFSYEMVIKTADKIEKLFVS